MSDLDESAQSRPALRVVTGQPTDEELAALVAVVTALSAAGATTQPAAPKSEWAAPRHRMRPVVRRRPDGWRRSALPH